MSMNTNTPRDMRRTVFAFLGVIWFMSGLAADSADAVAPGWLLRQAELEVLRVTGDMPQDARTWQTEFGGIGRSAVSARKEYKNPLLPMFMSLILPGAGELYLGHKRGFLLMAADIPLWYGGAYHAQKGRERRDEYYVYADQHWSEERLDVAYDEFYFDRPDADTSYDADFVGIGTDYYGFHIYDHPVTGLSLWVSKEDDHREYYENLGKWDQFVFGWDDFKDPSVFLGVDEFSPPNLRDPRTSANREEYRRMRRASNDAFAWRDRFLYLNIGLRVFSVLQVAYLEGLLSGGNKTQRGEPRQLSIGNHRVDLIVEPVGLSRGVLGAAVSF